ncbi:HNH endonuclease [Solicola sp. PLA-1-18]|uniref:HNH endonuclease n=1 Tax=Solicola sp. PLA-1-18 TaxID=3380532 RepID=UPI003B77A5CC
MSDLQDLCPFCGQGLNGTEVNRDHIFVEAFGGRALIKTHTACNSRSGHQIEGKLFKPGEQLNRTLLRGHLTDDPSVTAELDLRTGRPKLQPVSTADDPGTGTRTYTLRGDREEVRKRLMQQMGAKVGLTSEQIDQLVDGAEAATEPIEVTANLLFDLTLSRRLVAKVALGALARIDPGTIDSPFAQGLREVMWEQQAPELCSVELIAALESSVAEICPVLVPLAPQTGLDGQDSAPSRVVFVPVVGSTYVFVFLGTMLLSFNGIAIRHRLPVGLGLPVAFVDDKGGAQTRDLALEVLSAMRANGAGA